MEFETIKFYNLQFENRHQKEVTLTCPWSVFLMLADAPWCVIVHAFSFLLSVFFMSYLDVHGLLSS
jgi:hypothetical protein